MSTNIIEYTQFIGSNPFTPLSIDGVGYDLESEYTQSVNSVYSQCPVWKHRSNRVYTVRSPIDLHLSVDVDNQSLHSENLSQDQFDNYLWSTFEQPNPPGWCTEEQTTIQMTIPRLLFWTKKKNIWIEQRAHPLTSVNNNFVVVGGWFNLSNWTRPISFAFDVVDTNEPIIIRRGDPIYQVSFYSPNLDDGYILKKSSPSIEIVDNAVNRASVTNLFNKIPQSIKNKLFKNEESKCPFKFLWK